MFLKGNDILKKIHTHHKWLIYWQTGKFQATVLAIFLLEETYFPFYVFSFALLQIYSYMWEVYYSYP